MILNRSWKIALLFWGIIVLLGGCSGEPNKSLNIPSKAIAKVNQVTLYQNDLLGLVPANASKEDSLEIVNRYVNSWIRKQLIISKAQKEAKIDNAEIERKLLDYKYDLIAYAFEKAYIQKNLDTTVKEQEITQYYQENPANFELKQNIIQGVLIQIPLKVKEREEIKTQLQNNNLKKLNELCVKYATTFFLNDSTWVDFNELIKNTPFKQITNQVDFLKQNTFAETTNVEFVYYLQIKNYKIENQPSPLNFVRDRIISMIINQRKVGLIKKMEKEILTEAEKNKNFEIFN